MPHTKSGRKLKTGDKVIVHATVTQIYEGEDYCNVNVETDEPMFPGTTKSVITLNARQLELADTSDSVPLASRADLDALAAAARQV
jgi:hypothetical protein